MNRENKKRDWGLVIFKALYVLFMIALAIIAMWPDSKDNNTSPKTPEIAEIQDESVPSKVQEKQKQKEIKKKTTTKRVTTSKVNTNYKDGFTGFITHYGPNCKGCSGVTASGYNVRHTIYYTDKEYGQVRVVATSKKIPLYTVIKISNYKKGSITAIVLDRGVSGNKIDILVESEKAATKLGIQKNAKVEILRWGK